MATTAVLDWPNAARASRRAAGESRRFVYPHQFARAILLARGVHVDAARVAVGGLSQERERHRVCLDAAIESSMKPVVLRLSNPKVAALVVDVPAMQRWEILRRSASPMTVDQLAALGRAPREAIQAMLDRLVDAGFAVRIRATAARRSIAYRSVSEKVVIEYDKESASELAVVWASTQANTEYAREVTDRARAVPAIRTKLLHWMDGVSLCALTREDRREVAQLLSDAWLQIAAIGKRAQERAQTADSPETRGPTHDYLIQVVLQPLDEPELPMPELTLWSTPGAARHVERQVASPATVLGPRELEVARRLAAGESRTKLAASLNLSAHTVTTMTKRIYAKLRIHSRAELAARMMKG